MATKPLSDIRCKIDRADQQIKEFSAAIEKFKATHPYEILRQSNSQSGQIVYDVLRADDIPQSISAIAGDILQNLRTALDYIACAVVPGCRQNLSDKIYFPILKRAPTSDQIKAAFDGKVKGASQTAIDKIASLKPYQGGDDVLWRLNELNNINKHRLLVAVQSSASLIIPLKRPINLAVDEPSEVEQLLADTRVPIQGGFPLKKGGQLFVDASLLKSDQDVELLIEIAVNEPNICEGRPLFKVLRESFRRVFKITLEFIPVLPKV